MSFKNAVLKTAPTSFTVNGGTDLTFSEASPIGNKTVIQVLADTDLRTRRTAEATARSPQPLSSAPNGYSQARGMVVFKSPLLLENGKITVNTVRVEVAYDVETTPAEVQELVDIGAQILIDADIASVFKDVSTS